MPPRLITIKPPRSSPPQGTPQPQPQAQQHTSPPPPQQSSFTFTAPPPPSIPLDAFAPSSPVAPAFSPITPKVQPVLPISQNGRNPIAPPPDTNGRHSTPRMQPQPAPEPEPAIAPATYISQPPPKPFSSEDSTDAIALRAAISALQFQKKKAQDDIRSLEATKKTAVEHPQHFKEALVAGKLKEQRPQFGGVQAILDQEANDDDDSEEDVVMGATDHDERQNGAEKSFEVPDSQPSRPTTASGPEIFAIPQHQPPEFSALPGPQNVVRMPHVNWDKYHIAGDTLDRMHEQQRKWPGSSFAYNQDRGREFSVVAPYSPFLDQLQNADGARKDSVAAPHSALHTPTGSVSEHPMETRRSSKYQQHRH